MFYERQISNITLRRRTDEEESERAGENIIQLDQIIFFSPINETGTQGGTKSEPTHTKIECRTALRKSSSRSSDSHEFPTDGILPNRSLMFYFSDAQYFS
jgi:hypothetical protein